MTEPTDDYRSAKILDSMLEAGSTPGMAAYPTGSVVGGPPLPSGASGSSGSSPDGNPHGLGGQAWCNPDGGASNASVSKGATDG